MGGKYRPREAADEAAGDTEDNDYQRPLGRFQVLRRHIEKQWKQKVDDGPNDQAKQPQHQVETSETTDGLVDFFVVFFGNAFREEAYRCHGSSQHQ